jgi:hypothetical protein
VLNVECERKEGGADSSSEHMASGVSIMGDRKKAVRVSMTVRDQGEMLTRL